MDGPTRIAELSDPSDASLFQRMLEFRIGEIHTAMPGIVTKYDEAAQTVDVIPSLNSSYLNADGTSTDSPPPSLESVPVAFPRGGTFSMTFPLVPGDPVLLVFCERSIDEWSATGGANISPQLRRKHDWSDAIAIPGVSGKLQAIPGASKTDFILKMGAATLQISPLGVVTVTSPEVLLGGAGPAAARVGDEIEINVDDAKNLEFKIWISAASLAGSGVTGAFTGKIFGRITKGSAVVQIK